MLKKVKFSYTEAPDEKERIEQITEILSEGVYTCLKKQGLLRKDPGQSEKIKLLLEKTRAISDPDEKSEKYT